MNVTLAHLARACAPTILSCLVASNAAASADVFDLNADWSDVINPNATWSYRDGAGPITNHVLDWIPGATGPNPQPAWAATSQQGRGHIVSWFKSTNDVFDYKIGDIVVHSWDSANGANSPPANLLWIAPEGGSIDISGHVWLARNIGRAVDWSLLVNGTQVTSGHLFDGDPYSRAAPFDFTNGSGGAGVLHGIGISTGDSVQLVLSTSGTLGEFTGIQLEIDLASVVPEPATAWLLAMGIGVVCVRRMHTLRSAA